MHFISCIFDRCYYFYYFFPIIFTSFLHMMEKHCSTMFKYLKSVKHSSSFTFCAFAFLYIIHCSWCYITWPLSLSGISKIRINPKFTCFIYEALGWFFRLFHSFFFLFAIFSAIPALLIEYKKKYRRTNEARKAIVLCN